MEAGGSRQQGLRKNAPAGTLWITIKKIARKSLIFSGLPSCEVNRSH
jgi:hypothetical protein